MDAADPDSGGGSNACMREQLPAAGVFTPEGLFEEANARSIMLDRLLVVPGTLNYGYEESGVRVSGDSKGEVAGSEPAGRGTSVLGVVLDVWVVFINACLLAVGAPALLGLLLNIFGYGFEITPENGFEVGTIAHLRQEAAFRRIK